MANRRIKTVVLNGYNNTAAEKLTAKYGVSMTFARLMLRYNCATPDDYRKVRRINKITREQARVRNLPIAHVKTSKK